MGYRIVYGPTENGHREAARGSTRLRTMVAVILVLFSLTVRLTWQEGTDILREYLLPGEQTLTQEAFSGLVVDLRKGEHLKDALTVFCETIFNESA